MSRVGQQLRWALVWVAMAALVFPCSASPSPEDEIRALWASATEWRFPTNLHIRFRVHSPAIMTSDELAEAEARVAPFPEHPERRTLADEARRLANGPDVQSNQYWALDEDHWRRSGATPAIAGVVDTVSTSAYRWDMGHKILYIIDPRSPPPSGDMAGGRDQIAAYSRRLLLGNLGSYRGLEIASIEVSGDTAVLGCRREDGVAWRYDLVRIPPGGAWAVHRATLAALPRDPSMAGGSMTFEGWRAHPAVPSPWMVPERLVRRDARGRIVEVIDSIVVERLDRDGFERVAGIPSADGTEPIRGTLELTLIHDYRPSVATAFTATPTGMAATPIPATELGRAAPVGWRTVGWVVAAVLAIAFLWLRWWRSRTKVPQ